MKIRRITRPEAFKVGTGDKARKKRAKSKNAEHYEQRTLIQWAQLNERAIPALANLYAVPNGGKRNPATASILKAEGVKAGVPDLYLAWPTRGKDNRIELPGLYIEMKAGTGKPSPSQLEWRHRLIAAGYRYVLCFTWAQAANSIIEYLGAEFARYRVA